MNLSVNAFLAYLSSSLQTSGSETEIFLDRITTLTGETIATSDFSTFGRGTLTIDPLSSVDIEFASFTAVNATNISVTGAIRGLSAKSNTSSVSRMPYHAVGTPVIISFGVHNLEDLKTYIDSVLAGTVGNASTSVFGVTRLSVAPASPAAPIAVGDNDPRILTSAQSTTVASLVTGLIGIPLPCPYRNVPSAFVEYNGQALARLGQYATLFSTLFPAMTFTVTVASPAVFSATGHGLVAGNKVHFSTTGALPTGISAGVEYFVLSTGLTSSTFRIALSPEGTVINTSGTQSGVHTMYISYYGIGDGSTTFNVPDLKGRGIIGLGQGSQTLKFESGVVDTTNDWVTIPNYNFPNQGQAVILTTTGVLPTGLSLATTYYIIRLTATTIGFATSQSNANAGTLIDMTGAGSGVTTITYTNVSNTLIGLKGGEESHAGSIAELALHSHRILIDTASGGNLDAISKTSVAPSPTYTSSGDSGKYIENTGADSPHNNMSPYMVMKWMALY